MPRRQSPRRKRSRRSRTKRRSPKRSLRRRRYRSGSPHQRRSSPHQRLQSAFGRKSEHTSDERRKQTMAMGNRSLPLPPVVSYDVAARVVWANIKELSPPLMRDVENSLYILPYTYNGGLIAYWLPDRLSSDVPEFVIMFTATIVQTGGNAPPFNMTPLTKYEPARYQPLNTSGVIVTSLNKNDTRDVNMFELKKLQPNWGTVSEFVDAVRRQTSQFTCEISDETYKVSELVSIQSTDSEGKHQFPIVNLYRDTSTTIEVVQFAPSRTPCFGEFITLVLPSSSVSPTLTQSPPPPTITPTTPTTEGTSRQLV